VQENAYGGTILWEKMVVGPLLLVVAVSSHFITRRPCAATNAVLNDWSRRKREDGNNEMWPKEVEEVEELDQAE
jgi:hypothetical protein